MERMDLDINFPVLILGKIKGFVSLRSSIYKNYLQLESKFVF